LAEKPLVVITGASSGIGEAVARAFSGDGHPLLLMARRLDRMTALELPRAICAQVDVSDRDAVGRAVAQAEEQYGPADCLVNNAGVMLLGRTAEQHPCEWDRMIDVNVKGVLNGVHAVLEGMAGRGRGTIVNISSVAGRNVYPNHTVYCGTKFAVHAITEGIRAEVAATGVRLVTIAPGAVETELLGHTTNDAIRGEYEAWKKQIGGAIRSEDVAEAVLFAYRMPAGVCVREIVLAPTKQES
jgi:NADP-dependent 3-hydroxy acid dehydrogenase YdfG